MCVYVCVCLHFPSDYFLKTKKQEPYAPASCTPHFSFPLPTVILSSFPSMRDFKEHASCVIATTLPKCYHSFWLAFTTPLFLLLILRSPSHHEEPCEYLPNHISPISLNGLNELPTPFPLALQVTDDLRLVLNDVDALPRTNTSANQLIKCGHREIHRVGDYTPPEQLWPFADRPFR